ncbi:MAG: hypothetical protein E7J33_00670 [Peptostreptococcaceae bacterium]|nr:hypothetical protein [Peptostreptococcaceae bacterium]
MEKEGVNPLDIDQKGVGSLRMAVVNGDVDNGSFMAGQIASYINDVKPCKQIIEDIMEESKSILSKINKKLEV